MSHPTWVLYVILGGVGVFGVFNIVRYRAVGDGQRRFLSRIGIRVSRETARSSYLMTGVLLVAFSIVMILIVATVSRG